MLRGRIKAITCSSYTGDHSARIQGGTTTSHLHTIITEDDCLADMPADVVYTMCNLCTRDLPRAASVSGEMVSTKVSHCEERIHSSFAVCNPFGSCRYVA